MVFAEFLKQHVPSKCNVFLGGFLFHFDGSESQQIDVIITNDVTPRFDFHNKGGVGKSFAPVEGTIAVASLKSFLDKNRLYDALDNIASIPPTMLPVRTVLGAEINRYDEFPYKIVFANDGLALGTIYAHLKDYYATHNVPLGRRPEIIYVAGKYFIAIGSRGLMNTSVVTRETTATDPTEYYAFTRDPDIQAIAWIINKIQDYTSASTHILFSYGDMINKMNEPTAS